MKEKITCTIAMAILSLVIGFSSIAVAGTGTSATSGGDQMVVTLPEVVCTAEKTPIRPEFSNREYLNEVMESIRESLGQFQMKNIMEEVKSILDPHTLSK